MLRKCRVHQIRAKRKVLTASVRCLTAAAAAAAAALAGGDEEEADSRNESFTRDVPPYSTPRGKAGKRARSMVHKWREDGGGVGGRARYSDVHLAHRFHEALEGLPRLIERIKKRTEQKGRGLIRTP